MTDNYFFDTDCISAFLWIKNESILTKLYQGRIILPHQVYDEISKVPSLFRRVEHMKNAGELAVRSIQVDTDEYKDYCQLAVTPPIGEKIIGKGEAAAIAMTKNNDGILASNNLRDVKKYVEKYGLKHITTGDILVEALNQGIITEIDGNTIWANMIAKNRMLPTASFSDYLKLYYTNKNKGTS